MTSRTIAVGDVHGEMDHLLTLVGRLPVLTAADTLLFIGDYVDRGPDSAQVIHFLREELREKTPAKIVTLRGNHEDAWLKVIAGEDPAFVLPSGNGCLATFRSFQGGPSAEPGTFPTSLEEMESLTSGSFFPAEVVSWLEHLPFFYEDAHAIYVHGGLPSVKGVWPHPSEYPNPTALVWCREEGFFSGYKGKRVVFGHTPASRLPQHLSTNTPIDPSDVYISGDVIGIDTGCGSDGFLSAIELPSLTIYESRGA